jgi:hypothetical protein
MKANLKAVLIVSILLLWATVSWSATVYTFSKFDVNFPGAHSTEVKAINNKGFITGAFSDPQGDGWSYSRLQGRKLSRLYVAGEFTVAEGMNDNGEIIGYTAKDSTECGPGGSDAMGFRQWAESFIEYTCFSDSRTEFMDINNAGFIVGAYQPVSDPGRYHCFVWTPPNDQGGSEITTFLPAGSEGCRIHDITDTGVLAGSHQSSAGPSQGWVAASVADAVAGVFQFLAIPSARHSFVENVADDGSWQGTFVDESFLDHGFDRAPDGTLTVIDFPGAWQTSVKGGNGKGSVVGVYLIQNAEGEFEWHGWIGVRK